MKKLFLLFVGVYAVLGILVCVVACNTYFRAQDLEFQTQQSMQDFIRHTALDTVARPDTCKKCH